MFLDNYTTNPFEQLCSTVHVVRCLLEIDQVCHCTRSCENLCESYCFHCNGNFSLIRMH